MCYFPFVSFEQLIQSLRLDLASQKEMPFQEAEFIAFNAL